MNAQLKIILVIMLVDFTRKEILEKEIIFGAKKGIQKLEAVKNNFFVKSIILIFLMKLKNLQRNYCCKEWKNLKKLLM